MEPLINITTIPIRYELKIQHAKLEYSSDKAEVEISRNKGGLKIKSHPIRLSIDSSETYNSIRPNSMGAIIRGAAQKGENAVYNATASMAQEGRLMLNAKVGSDALSQIFKQRAEPVTKEFGLGFIPSVRPDMEWSDPDLTIEYQMDKLNFDLKIANGNFEFIPGDIEVVITQMPDIKIEYVGGPIYVPPRDDDSMLNVLA